jgi:hypothetical protein
MIATSSRTDGLESAQATIASGIEAGILKPCHGPDNGDEPLRNEGAGEGTKTNGVATPSKQPFPENITTDDFHAYMPSHQYIFVPSRELWPASSVDARLRPVPISAAENEPKLKQPRMRASVWLDKNRPVEQMTWAPGLPLIIQNRLVSGGGWIQRNGVACFNLYRPPTIELGTATAAGPWIDHVRTVYPKDADHIISFLAHRVQRPQEKINHALLLGGDQGIGKDTLLEPIKHTVGPWNFEEVSPVQMLGRFNGFVKSVVLRISEGRDLGDVDRYAFYEHMKVYTAAPPDVLRVDEKNLREHSVFNCCGVIITTNYKESGLYLPADDRRHYVAWSDLKKERFSADYWNKIWKWYEAEGSRHVAAYLATLDISGFDPKAPPPKTAAFWQVVDANRAPEDAELADILDELGKPAAVTLPDVQKNAPSSIFD